MVVHKLDSKYDVYSAGGQISVVQALLEELPGQFLTYMRCRDIRPHNISSPQTSAPGPSYAV